MASKAIGLRGYTFHRAESSNGLETDDPQHMLLDLSSLYLLWAAAQAQR